ncbi:MAG: hypothetical protein IGS03_08100 [Candidatus Sericytochromatia bacterium]|nr:hypothetical protein [Candidatus Sericytochromatia bacterium]
MRKHLNRKTSIFPVILVVTAWALEMMYQITCGSCSYTGTIQWWQTLLRDGVPILFGVGVIWLIWNLFSGLYRSLKGLSDDK